MARVGYEPLGSIKAWGSKGASAGCELLEQPAPKAQPGSCVVRVAAVGLNPTDWKHVGNGMHYYTMTKATSDNPVILGSEGSGTVEQVPEGSSFEVGQKVWFMAFKTCAELAEVKDGFMALAPGQMSMEESGSTPLALLTAYQSMKDAGYSEPGCGRGQRILVHAGAGGVGHFAVQLAKIYGFEEIVTTCSASNEDFVKGLGATAIVDYKTEDFVTKYANNKFDLVVDPVGGEPVGWCCAAQNALAQYTPRSRMVTKTGGTVVGIITGTSLQGAPCGFMGAVCCSCLPALCGYKCMSACGLGPKFVGPFFLRANEANVDLTRLREWVDQKQLRTEVAEVFRFEDAPKALETLEEGGGHNTKKSKSKPFRGKVVVKAGTELAIRAAEVVQWKVFMVATRRLGSRCPGGDAACAKTELSGDPQPFEDPSIFVRGRRGDSLDFTCRSAASDCMHCDREVKEGLAPFTPVLPTNREVKEGECDPISIETARNINMKDQWKARVLTFSDGSNVPIQAASKEVQTKVKHTGQCHDIKRRGLDPDCGPPCKYSAGGRIQLVTLAASEEVQTTVVSKIKHTAEARKGTGSLKPKTALAPCADSEVGMRMKDVETPESSLDKS
ncbi:rtn4ip1 [Symbiodinium microadriaticum]|nr:rtn4ip1 [Symbiodinium microadriaticum]